jgi:N-glycosylase/DNA lyase
MKQKFDAKTIVFAVKMLSYWARNIFKKIHLFPENINIPIDSRLIALFEEYKWNYKNIFDFYFDLSKKLNIPQLHLDAIVWVNYDNLINNKLINNKD